MSYKMNGEAENQNRVSKTFKDIQMKKFITSIILITLVSSGYSQNVSDPMKIQGYWEESHMGSVNIGWDGKHYVLKTDQYQAIQTKLENSVITYKYPNPGLTSNPSLPPYITGRITKLSNEKILYNNIEYYKVSPLESDIKLLLTSDYSDFNIFYSSFKKAVISNDKHILSELLEGMINFPFIDYYKKAYNESGLSTKYSGDFENKYNLIFNVSVLAALKDRIPTKLNFEDLTELEKRSSAEYVLQLAQSDYPSLLFGKINGRYMLIGIKYFE